MSEKLDYKKAYKDLYIPKATPSIIEIPPMNFIMVEGSGDPNSEAGEYQRAMQILYSLSYTIKMAKMGDEVPEGYFEYVVPPLEGLWWVKGCAFDGRGIADKQQLSWISMIRQPEFVTPEVFEWAKEKALKKDPTLDFARTRLETWEEGLCAQIMHFGPYDDEPTTIERLTQFILDEGYVEDIAVEPKTFPLTRRHHEIYLGDPRKTAPEKLKTVVRHPILPA